MGFGFGLLQVAFFFQSSKLSLDNLITHESIPQDAEKAYQTAFTDKQCLKMILNWRPQ